jgi:hypothetical protein
MLWVGLSLLPMAVILGVWCIVLQVMATTYPSSVDGSEPNKLPCFFSVILLIATVCLAIADAFDDGAGNIGRREQLSAQQPSISLYLRRRKPLRLPL